MQDRPAPPRRRHAAALAACLIAAAASPAAWAMEFGVNIHRGGTPEFNARRAAVMQQRNLKHARMDYAFEDDVAALRDQVQKIRAIGGSVQVVLWPHFGSEHACSGDAAAVEKGAYEESVAMIDKVKDVVHDFELLNESQLRPEVRAETDWNNMGLSSAAFQGKPCLARLAAGLRGMSKAVRDVRARSGLPLRAILGEVGRDFGFISFMQEQGVLFDVVGFHAYQKEENASLLADPWWGPGGPYAQLAKFGKPVHFNEFNCGETYEDAYENKAGEPVTDKCLRAFAKHLRDLTRQKSARIEYVYIYELLDEPTKEGAEGRFGLMYDLDRPKPQMAVVAAFTGGVLGTQERCELLRRGLVTAQEIDARRRAANPSAPAAAAVRCE